MQKNILLLGGTGAIGDQLVNTISQRNAEYNIYVTSRQFIENTERVSYFQGNAMEFSFLKKILSLRHWDCIVDFMSYNLEAFKGRYILLLNSTDHYLFLSSARVYDFNNCSVNEQSERNLDSVKDKKFLRTKDYSLEKAKEENILFESNIKHWTIIRPYKTYSSKRLQLAYLEKENWLYRAMHGRPIVFSYDLCDRWTSLSNTKDVSECIANIIFDDTTKGEVFQIVTGDNVKWGEILNIYLEILNTQLNLDVNVVYGKNAYKIWKGKPDYTIQYDSLKDHIFDNTKIHKLIKTHYDFIPLKEGLENCIKTFQENPVFLNIDWKQEAHFDRICHCITNINEIPNMKDKIIYLVFRFSFAYEAFVLLRKIRNIFR